MLTPDLEAVSSRYFAAWADRDPDAIAALHTEDTRFWTQTGAAPVVGRGAVRDTFAGLVARKDTFIDSVQLQAALSEVSP